MRTTNYFLACAIWISSSVTAVGQGTFQNFGFESASVSPIPSDPYGRIQCGPAFPGWTGYVGDTLETAALHNNIFNDSSGISLLDSGWPFPFGGVIEGNFTVVLQAGFALGTFEPADTSLVQSGQIPIGTESLRFRAYADLGSGGSYVVTLGGQTLSLVPLSIGANYTTFGADVASWAGQSANLRFRVVAERPHRSNAALYLDSIQFSNQPIPEPSISRLFVLGALLLGWRWRRIRTS